jgi:hypothetical protein
MKVNESEKACKGERKRERKRENFSMVIAHCMSTGNKTEFPLPLQ